MENTNQTITKHQQEIIENAAKIAHKLNPDDPSATVDFFVHDYIAALLSNDPTELAELYFAIASLDLVSDAEEITGLTDDTATEILQGGKQ